MKKIQRKLCALTAGVLTAAVAFQSTVFVPKETSVQAAATYVYGDVDRNDHLDVFDLISMKRLYANSNGVTSIQKEICDLDESGAFDIADIEMLGDYLVGRIDSFPAGTVYEHE